MRLLEKRNTLPILAGMGMATIFGMSFMFSKLALDVSSPIELISFRFLFAFLAMSILIAFKIVRVDFKGKNLKNLFLLSLSQPITYFIFESYGIKMTSSSQAGIMVALIPIFVAGFGVLFLGEKTTKGELFFIILSVAGVGFTAYAKNSDLSSEVFGIVMLMGAVISASFFNIISRKISSEFSSSERTYSMMFLGALSFNLINIISKAISGNINSYFDPITKPEFIIALLYLSLLSSIVAFFLVNYSLTHLEASKAAVFSNLATVVSIIAGVVFLKESFTQNQLLGSLMILSGVFGAQYLGIIKKRKLIKI